MFFKRSYMFFRQILKNVRQIFVKLHSFLLNFKPLPTEVFQVTSLFTFIRRYQTFGRIRLKINPIMFIFFAQLSPRTFTRKLIQVFLPLFVLTNCQFSNQLTRWGLWKKRRRIKSFGKAHVSLVDLYFELSGKISIEFHQQNILQSIFYSFVLHLISIN